MSNEDKLEVSVTEDYGASEWNVPKEEDPNRRKRADWTNMMRLKNGSNVVRIITRPYRYWLHKYQPDSKVMPDKIKCSLRNGSCVICDMLDPEGKQKYRRFYRNYVGVIDRSTNEYKVLDLAPSIFTQVSEYKDSEHWGNPLGYDVMIKVNPNNPPPTYYTVMPLGKTDLSDSDKSIVKDVDFEDLELKCMPTDPVWVAKSVASVNKKRNVEVELLPKKEERKPTAKPLARENVQEDDDDIEFPSYEEDD